MRRRQPHPPNILFPKLCIAVAVGMIVGLCFPCAFVLAMICIAVILIILGITC